MDFNLYVVQYSAISSALVEAKALTLYDWLNGFIDGLPDRIRQKVLDHAAEENWKLFTIKLEGTIVDFETLKGYVDVLVRSE